MEQIIQNLWHGSIFLIISHKQVICRFYNVLLGSCGISASGHDIINDFLKLVLYHFGVKCFGGRAFSVLKLSISQCLLIYIPVEIILCSDMGKSRLFRCGILHSLSYFRHFHRTS